MAQKKQCNKIRWRNLPPLPPKQLEVSRQPTVEDVTDSEEEPDGEVGGTMARWVEQRRGGWNNGEVGGMMARQVERWQGGWNDGKVGGMMARWVE